MANTNAATRIYTIALSAFPKRHRAAYAAEMIDTFQHELLTRRKLGVLHATLFILAACVNAIAAGVGERRRHRRVLHTNVLFSRLDFLLAWRMMLRYPGLSIVAIFGMAMGIGIAAGGFAILSTMADSKLPFDEGDRIVSIHNTDAVTGHRDERSLHDLAAWRGMTSVEDVGVTRTIRRNLILQGQAPAEVRVAEISASAFRIARVPPLRGRYLLPEDERAGAPDAVVIGYDEWLRTFAGDPQIVGRSLQLGSTTYAIVGVMPKGFKFPLSHDYWIPSRLDPAAYAPGTGPSVNVFGKLARGATLQSAQAEIQALNTLSIQGTPGTLIPRVIRYTHEYNEMDDPENALALYLLQIAIVLLLVVVSVNVAILVYARTATRLGEIAVRVALGAGRRRIVAQLFVEALMLAGLSAGAGLFLADVALRQLNGSMLIIAGNALPFWMTLGLQMDSVLYVTALALLSAVIIGVFPAVKATNARVHTRLQTLSPGSGSKMAMGKVWASLIVAQVALTVTLLPASMYHAYSALSFRIGDLGFATGQFLTTQMSLDRVTAPGDAGERAFTERFVTLHRELDRRVREEAMVSDVTFAMAGIGEERTMVLEIEGRPAPLDGVHYNIVEGTKQGHQVLFNRVATNYFSAFDVPVIMGRNLQAGDADRSAPSNGVLVNRPLVDNLFGGANPLGTRIRYVGRSREAAARDVELNRWYEIVGVVPDFPAARSLAVEPASRIYHAANFGDVQPAEVAIRIRGNDPTAFSGRLREIGASVDPNMLLRDIASAESILKREQGLMRLIGVTVTLVMLSVIVLAAAGMYALMSFTVAQRKREIGIRAALGANRNRLLAGIFARALAQISAGVVIGLLGAVALEGVLEGEMFQGQGAVLVPMVILVMAIVGTIAVAGPARRGLRIQPIEALREE
ncbi:MAG TPA: ABC transporter permease [Vicinamibacterales bacterium]|nr:ABC transporter permease [Vicinamibacterales bacterium]